MKVSQETGLEHEVYELHNGLSLGGRQVGGYLFFIFKIVFYHLTSPAKLNRII